MRVFVVFLALAACVSASGVHDGVVLDSSLGAVETSYTNQPVVVVRKTTYYEPELVAVVVEKGVDDIPEETYLIQNYADVLRDSENEIRLCAVRETNRCLDTPVTKMLVPSLFQSIGQNGFQSFFEQAKEVPWLCTIDDVVEAVRPMLVPKNPTLKGENLMQAYPYPEIKVVPPQIFSYVPESPAVDYRTLPVPVYPPTPQTSYEPQVPLITAPTTYEPSQTSYLTSETSLFPSNFQAGFAPLDQITSGGSYLAGTTQRTFQPTTSFYGNAVLRNRRSIPYPIVGYLRY